jgi:PTH1 family peptidyl-tRNA hydrolase
MTFLIAGLGNPGSRYAKTRHNLGAEVVKGLGRVFGLSFREERRFNAEVAKGANKDVTVHLVLPLTYMNLSGLAVKAYVDYFKIPIDYVVIVVDDVALPFGQLRLRGMGSAGGHNGLKSIEQSLGTSDYIRLRMGVGHPGEGVLADYVLEPFSQAEQEQLPIFIDRGVEVLQRLLQEPFLNVMNDINTASRPIRKKVSGQEPNIPKQG